MSAPSSPVQLMMRTPQPGFPEIFNLTEAQITIGRHPSNTIVLPFDSISRFHARIDRRGEFFILQDLNSSNGSFVNGERVTQMTLHHGDAVSFGNVEFAFSNESSQSGLSTHTSEAGKSIVDIFDDRESTPTSQAVRKADDVSKEKSSVISSISDKKADKATLVQLNARLHALYKLSELLRDATGMAEEEILGKVLDLVFEVIPADRGVILTRQYSSTTQLEVAAVRHRDQPIVPQKVTVSRTILEKVLTQKVAILTRNAQNDDRFEASESIIMSQLKSAICVPMIMHGEVMGALHMDITTAGKPLTEEDLEFAMIIASETGTAIDNMRMRKAAIHRERLAAVGETVAGISHNVKNILLLSQGGSELLTRALAKNDMESARESWGVVKRGIDKIGNLVREMLAFSSTKQPHYQPTDINRLIESIAEEVESRLIQKNIMLELDLDDNIGDWNCDEGDLHKTIYNMVANAMDAITHKEGRILITTRMKDTHLQIVIQDNGCGIPKDKIEKMFFPFFTTKGSAGTGLGLPMCKKSVEDMGGKIIVESEENVGTSFIIELPPREASAEQSDTEADE